MVQVIGRFENPWVWEILEGKQNVEETFNTTNSIIFKQSIASIWYKNMPGYLSADIICFKKQTVLRECSSRKTVSYKEQIMSKHKCARIFSPQMKGIVFIMLQILFATCAILKIREYSQIFLSFSWGILGLVMCLDPSCANKNIWWIVIAVVIKYNIQVIWFSCLTGL